MLQKKRGSSGREKRIHAFNQPAAKLLVYLTTLLNVHSYRNFATSQSKSTIAANHKAMVACCLSRQSRQPNKVQDEENSSRNIAPTNKTPPSCDCVFKLINCSTSDVHIPAKWNTFVNTPV